MRVFEFCNKNGSESVSETGTGKWPFGTPLGDLVRQVKDERGISYRKLAEKAVDPKTKERVGYTTFHRIANDERIQVSPGVLGAIAAALGKPDQEVRVAASHQYCGLIADNPFEASAGEATVVVVHAPGVGRKDMPKVENLLRRYAAGELPTELTEDDQATEQGK
ncbi:helix-turn-helix domain-containing protein [Streptomyces mobaraensis]|uniref:Helix-turn-helix domain-containing protein n=1 Tax=Streptomyces mobaraensis TaxID=35621 RepID=A0A5N5VZ85_STRMB|nr:helix-turn-helix domain-containing protein [Streptomyces mobaraensis]